MTEQEIKELALANGFKLKEQANGNMDLNPYVYDFARALMQTAQQQWISVDDRLPEKEGFYLVFTAIGTTSECQFYCGEFIESYVQFQEVTHWQPLPEPPAQEPTSTDALRLSASVIRVVGLWSTGWIGIGRMKNERPFIVWHLCRCGTRINQSGLDVVDWTAKYRRLSRMVFAGLPFCTGFYHRNVFGTIDG